MLKVLDPAREDNGETLQGAVPTLDALAREGARRMLAAALEEHTTSRRTPMRATGTAGGWWSATAVRSRER